MRLSVLVAAAVHALRLVIQLAEQVAQAGCTSAADTISASMIWCQSCALSACCGQNMGGDAVHVAQSHCSLLPLPHDDSLTLQRLLL